MPDGSQMTWNQKDCEHLDLATALSRYQAGAVTAGVCVELGEGRVARLEPGQAGERVLQRLMAHGRLCALAESLPQSTRKSTGTVNVDPEVKALLDAVRRTR
jgi:hypothetical protein